MHNTEYLGPESSISKEIDEMKYRQKTKALMKIKEYQGLYQMMMNIGIS